MKTRLSLTAFLLSLGLLAGQAQAHDYGPVIGGGVGAVAGAVIGDSVGGRGGAIIGSGVGAVAGVVIGGSMHEPVVVQRYWSAPVVEYRYYDNYYGHRAPRGHAWGHDRHRAGHGHSRHHHRGHGRHH